MVEASPGDTEVFGQCLAITLPREGGLSMDPQDPGNWTGGSVGSGLLRGTKWGISSAAHPEVDLATLTMAQRDQIYLRDYWLPSQCHLVPGPLAALMFDSAVNNGPGHRVGRWVQQTLGVVTDGWIGPKTLKALRGANRDQLLAGFQGLRFAYHLGLPGWPTYGKGWTERLLLVLLKSQDVEEGPEWK